MKRDSQLVGRKKGLDGAHRRRRIRNCLLRLKDDLLPNRRCFDFRVGRRLPLLRWHYRLQQRLHLRQRLEQSNYHVQLLQHQQQRAILYQSHH